MATVMFTPSSRSALFPIGAIEAEEIEFGLVIHPSITADGTLSDSGHMAISEPITGCRVACGYSREMAFESLSLVIRDLGGEDRFVAALRSGIARFRAAQS